MSGTTTLPPLAVASGAHRAGVSLKHLLANALRAAGFAGHDPGTAGSEPLDCFDRRREAAQVAKLGKVGKVAA
jgi:hypothetical protein